MQLPPTKIMECKVCGVEIKVNASYPITEVTCQECHRKKNDDSIPPSGLVFG